MANNSLKTSGFAPPFFFFLLLFDPHFLHLSAHFFDSLPLAFQAFSFFAVFAECPSLLEAVMASQVPVGLALHVRNPASSGLCFSL